MAKCAECGQQTKSDLKYHVCDDCIRKRRELYLKYSKSTGHLKKLVLIKDKKPSADKELTPDKRKRRILKLINSLNRLNPSWGDLSERLIGFDSVNSNTEWKGSGKLTSLPSWKRNTGKITESIAITFKRGIYEIRYSAKERELFELLLTTTDSKINAILLCKSFLKKSLSDVESTYLPPKSVLTVDLVLQLSKKEHYKRDFIKAIPNLDCPYLYVFS
jgi:hypothetical protein